MLVFPNCKINLGLNIVSKRQDGFHNIETVFYPVAFTDALEVITSSDKDKPVVFSQSGLAIDGKEEDNLCVKAFHLLKKDFSQLPNIKMHLHKAIPTGAGLGGGSADAAFTLTLLHHKYLLNLSIPQLINYALRLGSDCPFFIKNKPCFAGGRGEILEEINLDLSAYKMVLINPGIHINTGWAFSQIQPRRQELSIKEVIKKPVEAWKHELKNDFEGPVFEKYPEIEKIKINLYNAGAVYAAMSGSGSTVFGLFKKGLGTALDFPSHYFIKEIDVLH